MVVEVIGVGVGERGGGGGGGGGPERAVEPIWYLFLHHFYSKGGVFLEFSLIFNL